MKNITFIIFSFLFVSSAIYLLNSNKNLLAESDQLTLIGTYCKNEYLNRFHAAITSKLNGLTMDEAISQMENDLDNASIMGHTKMPFSDEFKQEFRNVIAEVYSVDTDNIEKREIFMKTKYEKCLIKMGVVF